MLLARKGRRVLVVDKATFPSDTLSTHFVTGEGVSYLEKWGLMERVMATGVPPINDLRMFIGDTLMPQRGVGLPSPICPRRTVLDKLLVDAAVEAGAEVREGFSVDEILFDGERATGIRGHGRDGVEVTESANIVIGADGKNSFVAKAVGAAEYNTLEPATCAYYGYWSGVEADGAEIHIKDGRMVFVFPTHDNQVCAGTEWLVGRFDEFRQDIEGNLMRTFESTPGLAQRIRGGKREEKIMGTAGHRSWYRKPFGPGWALAGDSGFMKDPLLGQGISDAFRDVALLTAALEDAWSGGKPLEEALAGYEAQRNAATMMIYQVTNMLISNLDPSPELQMMMAAGPPPQAV
jgi:2-polyprenyl-6-methoxyphenol hydroxylase-like FAD-dependent oxidoreductase